MIETRWQVYSRKLHLPELFLAAYGLVMLGYLLFLCWPNPISDGNYGFRQTQTAISAYWLSRHGTVFDYQTPVLGHPWSIPFEFPLYQWIIAGVSGGGSVPEVDHAGRLLNIVFFLGSVTLVHSIARLYSNDRRLALVCSAALLASPLMLFWSRAVMIESTALFFGLLFVWGLGRFSLAPARQWALLTLMAAIVAALVKITTFFGFGVFVCGAMLVQFAGDKHRARRRHYVMTVLLAGVGLLASLVILKLWLIHADELKAQTIWGASLSSGHLEKWNYGNMAQRLDPGFWRGIVLGRVLRDVSGSSLAVYIAIGIVLATKRTRPIGSVLLLSYLAPFAVFTNLHAVHEYYQYANAIFVTTLVGMAIWVVTGKDGAWRRSVAWLSVLALSAMSWHGLETRYLPLLHDGSEQGREMQIARYLKRRTGEGDVLLLFGLDWSSTVPYYSERKALMMPEWLSEESFRSVLDPQRAFGGARVGALVACPMQSVDAGKIEAMRAITALYARGMVRSVVAGCEVYSGSAITVAARGSS